MSAWKNAAPCYHVQDTGLPSESGGHADLDILAAELNQWVQGHAALYHPIFDYLETTAQLPELSAFIEAEITEEHRLRILTTSASSASVQQQRQSSCDAEYNFHVAEKIAAVSLYSETYLGLIQYTAQQLAHSAAPANNVMFVRANTGLSELMPTAGFACRHNISAIRLVIRNIQSHQWRKLLRGCTRLGIFWPAPRNCKDDMAMNFSGNYIESTLREITSSRPLLALDWVKSIPIYMDWKTGYYDSLFSTILVSL